MKKAMVLLFIGVFVFIAVLAVISLSGNRGKEFTYEEASERITSMMRRIDVNTVTPYPAQIELGARSLAEELPEIDSFSKPVSASGAAAVEIFSSTEKASSKNDNWLVEVAEEFNRQRFQTASGETMGVTLWSISSGTAVDYIISGKYVPDAFTPSNELWGEMVRYSGVDINKISNRLAGNVAGILMDRTKNAEFTEKYGEVNALNITRAVEAKDILMGYTNPFASSTGLNFLLSVLYSYDSDPLSAKAIAGFDVFQSNVPSVAHSTLEMRDSMVQRKTLDAMVMEYQLYKNEPSLSSYVFTPFGVRHDSPMYEIGTLSAEKSETLKAFVEFCLTDEMQKLASDKGFNYLDDYVPSADTIPADTIVSSQQLWKERKNAGRPVAAFFVADTSGSMIGEPIDLLKSSLVNAANYIDPENYIGLISYNSDVSFNLPIAKFDLNQQSLFVGSVNALDVGGNTSTYDAVVVALDELRKIKEQNPEVKPIIFLLSDGEQNSGYSLTEIEGVVKGTAIPVYTIGYNANISELEKISQINEASTVNAESGDITYILKGLFNAQM
ncbi:MAG: VWA domain-containing protein [Clostridiales bacterium]|nr:VWA domain-containing protein [Clostridiales bacterium]